MGFCLLAGARWVLLGRMAGVVRMRLLLGIVERAVSRRTRLSTVTKLGWNRLQCYISFVTIPSLHSRLAAFCLRSELLSDDCCEWTLDVVRGTWLLAESRIHNYSGHETQCSPGGTCRHKNCHYTLQTSPSLNPASLTSPKRLLRQATLQTRSHDSERFAYAEQHLPTAIYCTQNVPGGGPGITAPARTA